MGFLLLLRVLAIPYTVTCVAEPMDWNVHSNIKTFIRLSAAKT
uniref:Uncharacterized protein n=1 Tax=Echinococcus canadensis TaxID=519352 RepID=A0A915EY29_9CEST